MKGKPLYEQIYLQILSDIKQGKYEKGVRLPSEKELCDIYNVSRITGKKAMDMLAERNVIKRMPGKGSFVNEDWEDVISPLTAPSMEAQKVIGVIMDGFGGSYGYKIILGIEKKCRDMGLGMMLHCTNGSKEEETRAIEQMLLLGIEGIIIMCVHGENYNSMVLKLAIEQYPIVLIDRSLKGVPVSFVGTDNHKAAKELTDWLFEHGHEKISFVSHCDVDTPTIAERQMGFLDSHLERGLSTNESLWITDLKATLPAHRNEISLREDFEKIEAFIHKHHDIKAFFAVEYDIAKIVQSVVKKMKLEDEYTIVCFDGYDSIIGDNEFTHVCQDEMRIGEVSVSILNDKLNHKYNIEPVLIPYRIVEAEK